MGFGRLNLWSGLSQSGGLGTSLGGRAHGGPVGTSGHAWHAAAPGGILACAPQRRARVTPPGTVLHIALGSGPFGPEIQPQKVSSP